MPPEKAAPLWQKAPAASIRGIMSITVASTHAWTIVRGRLLTFREMRVFLQKQLHFFNQFFHPLARKRH